ncbi:MAG TPA: PAAR domain-containing protein [Vicinamibacteria bacterium]|jgi:uncharacterized Zn-binding protein involved in type VI secretion
MGQPAARKGDRVVALDTHLIQPPGPTSPVPVPHPFSGIIDGAVSADVKIGGAEAATKDSTATNTPSHIPMGGTFVNPPSNKATIVTGSATVTINKKAAARAGDTAKTCNDPVDLPVGTVVAVGQVLIG